MTTSVVPPSVDERRQRAARFAAVYQQSVEQPEEFWAEAAAEIDWVKPWERVLDDSRAPFYRWFAGGQLNTCYNALDRHVDRGRAEQLALIYDSPVTDTATTFTYRELRDTVATFAGALAAQGVGRGDRVVIYMPMVPEAAIAMLPAPGSERFTPWCSVGSRRTSWRGGSRTRSRRSSCRHRAGLSRDGWSPTSRCSTPRSTSSKPSRTPASLCNAHSSRPSSSPDGISRGSRQWPTQNRPSALLSRPRIRSTSSTRPAPRACRRGSCVTTAVRRSL